MFLRAVELSSQERWAEAAALFRQSHAAVPRASTAYNLTLALLHLGRGREALDLLAELRIQVEGEAAPYRDQLETMRAHALKLVARVSIHLEPATAALTVDGVAIAGDGSARQMLLDPGSHELRASAPGFEPSSVMIHAQAGAETSQTITLRAQPAAPVAPPRVLEAAPQPAAAPITEPPSEASSGGPSWPAFTLMAAGGAALATGGVLGMLALSNDTKHGNRCPSFDACPPRAQKYEERAKDFALASDVALLSGVALAGAGVLWWMLEGDDEAPRVGAVIAPGLAGMTVSQCF